MATSVALTLHGLLAGETFTPAELRSGMLSRLGVAQDATTALKARPGIMPGAGTPGAVSQASTPAMKVLVKAGSFVVVAPGSPGGVYTCSLTADTEIDIATAPGSNSRWDVIGVKVFDNGSAPTCTLESVAGTAAASPALPSAITSPATDTYWFPLARVVVGTSVTTIVNANISKPAASGGLPNFGQFTVAPGGLMPASSTTDAAGLPLFSQWILPTGEIGIKHPNGTSYQYGNMHRYLHGVGVSTGGAGDFTVNTSVVTNGGVVASSFPNACIGAMLFDATPSSTFNEPIWFKLQAKAPNFCSFRAYKASGVFTGATIDVVGIAWGW